MCGIVGIIGREQVAPLLVDALKRLEYRGYDSAGVATLENGLLDRRRVRGAGRGRGTQDGGRDQADNGDPQCVHRHILPYGVPNQMSG